MKNKKDICMLTFYKIKINGFEINQENKQCYICFDQYQLLNVN